MGLENNTFAKYLSIGDGKITKRVKEPTDNSTQRVLKNGNTINEEIYDAISGLIVDIKTQDHPSFGRFWNITLQDGSETFILQMNYSGGYASAFLKMLPNIDLKTPVRIIPSMKMEGTKKKVSLFITQHGEALKHYYTKDNPNGLPPMEKVKVKKNGKVTEQWDDNNMMEFLERMVVEEIQPKLRGAGAKVNVTVHDTVTVDNDAEIEEAPF
jgi:hypothetical protein